jgi:hypothetical protein
MVCTDSAPARLEALYGFFLGLELDYAYAIKVATCKVVCKIAIETHHRYMLTVALTRRRDDRGPLSVGLLPLGGAHVVHDLQGIGWPMRRCRANGNSAVRSLS